MLENGNQKVRLGLEPQQASSLHGGSDNFLGYPPGLNNKYGPVRGLQGYSGPFRQYFLWCLISTVFLGGSTPWPPSGNVGTSAAQGSTDLSPSPVDPYTYS